LARRLFEHVLGAASPVVDGVLVATDSDEVAAAARGAAVRRDAGAGTLAEVVDAALADVAARGATRAIVLMADLPRITSDDGRGVLEALGRAPVVVVPDRHRRHTNALGLEPPTRIATAFGTGDSFARHRAAPGAIVLENERLGLDIDVEEDLARF